jgi:hypothetical protein
LGLTGLATFTGGITLNSNITSNIISLSVDSIDTTNFTMTSNDENTVSMLINSTNIGSGEAHLDLLASDELSLSDGTLKLILDGGALYETGLTDLELTGSGNCILTTDGFASLGNSTGNLFFSSSGGLSTNGITTFNVFCSDNINLNSSGGSINIGNGNDNQSITIAANGTRNLQIGSNSLITTLDIYGGTTSLNTTSLTIDATGLMTINANDTRLDTSLLSIDSTDTTNFTMTANDENTVSMSITANNSGTGEAHLDLLASDELSLSDGTLTLILDGGSLYESGLIDLDITGSGHCTITGNESVVLGNSTGNLFFSNSGGLSTNGITTFDVSCTGNINMNSSGGSINIGNYNNNQSINLATNGTRDLYIGSSSLITALYIYGSTTSLNTNTLDIDTTGLMTINANDTRLDTSLLSIDSTDTTNFTMTANDENNVSMIISANNNGTGKGALILSASDEVILSDETLTLKLDGGSLYESGLTDLELTGSGNCTITGDGTVSLGNSTGNLLFNSSGALSTNGITTFDVSCSGNINMNSSEGSINIGNNTDDEDINLGTNGNRTLTIGSNISTTTLDIYGGTTSFNTTSLAIDATGLMTINANDTRLDTSLLSIDSTDTTNFTMTANDESNISMSISANNNGTGEGILILSAGDELILSDDTLTLRLDSGYLYETGLTDLELTGSGNCIITGDGSVSLGNSTGYLLFNSSGGLSTNGITTFDVSCTGNINMNSSGGSINIGNYNNNQSINLATDGTRTLTIGSNTSTTTLDIYGGTTSLNATSLDIDTTQQINIASSQSASDSIVITSSAGGISMTSSSYVSIDSGVIGTTDSTITTGTSNIETTTSGATYKVDSSSGTVIINLPAPLVGAEYRFVVTVNGNDIILNAEADNDFVGTILHDNIGTLNLVTSDVTKFNIGTLNLVTSDGSAQDILTIDNDVTAGSYVYVKCISTTTPCWFINGMIDGVTAPVFSD